MNAPFKDKVTVVDHQFSDIKLMEFVISVIPQFFSKKCFPNFRAGGFSRHLFTFSQKYSIYKFKDKYMRNTVHKTHTKLFYRN